MPLTPTQLDEIGRFRTAFEDQYRADSRFGSARPHERPDGSLLATRWTSTLNPHVWFEIAVRPNIPQVRVGVVTDDRWKSEDFEDKIEESGDTMREFVELGLEEAGLEWLDPPVEHFREDTKYFYFATALDLKSIDHLNDERVRNKVRQMFEGYYYAFGPFVK